MVNSPIYFAIYLLFLEHSVNAATIRKYFYQKDLSEYCRRRVVPSVFLGRHVVEAHSKILHFSRMDLPYSCFISVRAESGSNVMLVAQLPSDESLVSACSESPSQLLVYEMGETFGGYWGPLPESVVRPEPTDPEIYTRQTTERSTTRRKLSYQDTTEPSKPTNLNADENLAVTKEREEDFVKVVVPIVNVSGKLEPLGGRLESGFDPDDIFDLLYDVTPRNGGIYRTSLLPIVQFSLQKSSGRREEGFRYNLEVDYDNNEQETTDTSLFSLHTERITRRKTHRTNFYVKKLMTTKKTRPRSTKRTRQYFRKNIQATSASSTNFKRLKGIPLHDNDLVKFPISTSTASVKTWEEKIHEMMRKLNKSSSYIDKYKYENDTAKTLDVISNMKNNRSAYLISNWNPLASMKNNKTQATQGIPRTLNESSSHKTIGYKSKLFEAITNAKHNRSVYLLPNWNVFTDQPHQNEHDILVLKSNGRVSHIEKYDSENKNLTGSLDNITNANHNSSVYLLPNWESLVDQMGQNHQLNAFPKQFTSKTLSSLGPFTFASTKNIKQFLQPARTTNSIVSIEESTSNKNVNRSTNDDKKRTKSTKRTTETTTRGDKTEVTDNLGKNTVGITKLLVAVMNTTTGSTQIHSTRVSTESNTAHVTKSIKGNLVNHESWENVVQAAPVMVEILNQTVSDLFVNPTINFTTQNTGETTTKSSSAAREKRRIQPIPIEFARPHNRPTSTVNTTTTASSFGLSDMQEFAQLVELQDDELHERVALRYLRHYTGPMLFNICDYVEPNARHVYLFNSSRVVLALHNFTLERMTVMLTPAWTLLSGVAQCTGPSLECQVYGTRICIDSSNACDGIPNCGAYDIYDEDRLMCGAAEGLQHNVYLAAITFLAVMLTMIYTVHYWLRRCVPKVSEAFFIYTNGAENILYLETIMRSPHDVDEGPKMTYNAHLFEDEDYLAPHEPEIFRPSIFKRIIRSCLNCCNCSKSNKRQSSDELISTKTMYSFTEFELSRIMSYDKGVDVGVQTSGSLDRTETTKNTAFQLKSMPERPKDNRRMAKVGAASEDDFQKHVHELNMIKMLKGFKTEHKSPPRANATNTESYLAGELDEQNLHNLTTEPIAHIEEEEEELETHFYDHLARQMPVSSNMITTSCVVHPEKASTSKPTKKCLRFEEQATIIPSITENDDYQIKTYEDTKHHDGHDDISPQASGGGRDFKSFWKTKKSKKKKTHLALH